MINLNLTEEQFKYLFALLDRELKTGGLNSLTSVVGLHNVLVQSAQTPVEVTKISEKSKADSSESD